VAELPSGLAEARAVAAGADGRIYLAGDRAVRILPAGAATRPARGVREIALDAEPQALAVAADGTVYVGLADHVQVYGAGGARQAVWPPPGEGALLGSVAVGESDVFLADIGNKVVLRYGLDGRLRGWIGQKDPSRDIPGFSLPSGHLDLAMGPDGLLRATNPGRARVETYTAGGDLELSWGRPGNAIEAFCGCCNPVNIAVDADGRVVTCEKGLRRVKLYDAHGKFLGVVAGPDSFGGVERASGEGAGPLRVLDVAVDPEGRIWVLDTHDGIVRVFAGKAAAP